MSRITVVGMGYVGLSLSLLLSRKNEVIGLDVIPEKIDKLNRKESPIKDSEIEVLLKENDINISFTLDEKKAYSISDVIIIATPTNYDAETHSFDTKTVENAIQKSLQYGSNQLIIIKSTIPIGFTDNMIDKFGYNNILFSPEFLREGKALYDNYYPNRIIVGCDMTDSTLKCANYFANLLKTSALIDSIPILIMPNKEAECVKLFSNTYLAMRVAYFNELDNFALNNKLNVKNIIEGICCDKRIGMFYNNPSFGYGGYCLPKDTKQLLNEYKKCSNNECDMQSIIGAIVDSNDMRKKFIVKDIIRWINEHKFDAKNIIVGIYRMNMKKDSDNFRDSSIKHIIDVLSKEHNVIIYEPIYTGSKYNSIDVYHDLNCFKEKSDIIITNRMSDDLKDVANKVYTRDVFNID